MSKDAQPAKPKASEREAKLAQALRANLRRRKAGADKPAGQGGAKADRQGD